MNYLEEIEKEYSRIRGKYSPLAPVDWNLAAQWEKDGMPLSVVLRAMSETWRNFEAKQKKGTINTLRYFAPEVDKQFQVWLESQIGKVEIGVDPASADGDKTVVGVLENNTFTAFAVSDETDILEYLAEGFNKTGLPNLLSAAAENVRRAIIVLIIEARENNISDEQIEVNLKAIAKDFDLSLVASFSDEERAEIIRQTKNEYANRTLDAESLQKILIRKLYNKFGLPELTLFEL